MSRGPGDDLFAGSDEVPLHLRNAPTGLARSEGHGAEYRYAHDEPGAFAAVECYLPPALRDLRFYHPVGGLEQRIAERLQTLRERNRASGWQRYRD